MKKKTIFFLVFLFFLIFSFKIYFSNPKPGWSDDFFVADGGISKIIQTYDGYLMIGFKKYKGFFESELFFTLSENGKEWSEPEKIFENGSIDYIDFLEKEEATYIIFSSHKLLMMDHIYMGKINEKQIQEIHEFRKITTRIYIDSLIFLDERKILVARTKYSGGRKSYLDVLEDGELKNIFIIEGEDPFLYRDKDGVYWLFYDKDDGKISYMTSADGLDWSEPKEIENSLTGMEPKLYQTRDGTYWLIYSVCTNCETLGLLEDVKKDLCYQTSVDGENWSNPVAIVSGDNISPWDILETHDGRIILVWSDCKDALSSIFSGEECGRIYVKIFDEREIENDKIPFYLKSFVKSFAVSLVLVFIFYFLISVFYILFFGGGKIGEEGKTPKDSEK